MDIDHPEYDQRWDDAARSETGTERLDRNWASLLQEMRVVQTVFDTVAGTAAGLIAGACAILALVAF